MDCVINIPDFAKTAIEMLKANGYQGYLVGGCVRDYLLGKEPHDFDICTDCTPDKMLEVFSSFRTVETGIRHGTLTVIIQGEPLEITTFRSDGEYSDHRRPQKVTFEKNLEEDLKRRDFTVNAMCYNSDEGIIDMFGGVSDLKNGIIKCVGEPSIRFDEDALRIVRGMRFASTLGFHIEEKTAYHIHEQKKLLTEISAERVSVEIKKLLCGKNVEKILMEYRDVVGCIIPELADTFDFQQNNPHHCYTVYEHICKSVSFVSPQWQLRLAMLLHDIGKPEMHTVDENGVSHFKKHQFKGAEMSVGILRRLKLDSKSQKLIHDLIYEHDNRIPVERKSVKRFIAKYDFDFFMDYLEVRRADTYAQSEYHRQLKLSMLDDLAKIAIKLNEENSCLKLSQLAVNGNDLIAYGIDGKKIGLNLKMLLQAVIEEKVKNNHRDLIIYLGENNI